MSLLPDWKILEQIAIDPVANGQRERNKISYGLSSYGYDLRIGRRFQVFDSEPAMSPVIDPKRSDWHGDMREVIAEGPDTNGDHYIIIPPNSFALGESVEELTIPRDVLGVCLGKSTYARCGIIVNITPLEPEWTGKVTIEISNTTPRPAKVYADEGICQVLFFRTKNVCQISYADKAGRYQGQTDLTMPFVQ